MGEERGGGSWLAFNVFGEGYLCLLKMLLFLSIRKLYFIQFLREIYMEKMLQELFRRLFLGAHTVQTVPKYIWTQHCFRRVFFNCDCLYARLKSHCKAWSYKKKKRKKNKAYRKSLSEERTVNRCLLILDLKVI